MSNTYKYILWMFLLCFVSSCEDTKQENNPEFPPVGDKIVLRSAVETPGVVSRAVADFPNGGSVGIMATKVLDPDPLQTDWSQYPDISNTEIKAVSESGGVYSFEWATPKYWPFDGANLYFMAYSPVTTEDNFNYILDAQNRSLFVVLQPNMPDIMYASGNTSPQPYNKLSGTVNLGEFRHAMSQLTVNVIAGTNLSPNIKVTDLRVITPGNVGSLLLPLADNGFNVTYNTVPFTGVLVDGRTEFVNGQINRSLLLFPGTEDVTEVSITLLDISNEATFTGNYMMSFFQNNVSDEPILLERAKNTILNITLEMSDVQNPNNLIQLNGRITDWTYGGQFGININ